MQSWHNLTASHGTTITLLQNATCWQSTTAAGLLEGTLKADNRQNRQNEQPSSSGASFTGSFTSKARPGLQGGKHRSLLLSQSHSACLADVWL